MAGGAAALALEKMNELIEAKRAGGIGITIQSVDPNYSEVTGDSAVLEKEWKSLLRGDAGCWAGP